MSKANFDTKFYRSLQIKDMGDAFFSWEKKVPSQNNNFLVLSSFLKNYKMYQEKL